MPASPRAELEATLVRARRAHDQSVLRPLNDWSVMVVASIELMHAGYLILPGVVAAVVMALIWR